MDASRGSGPPLGAGPGVGRRRGRAREDGAASLRVDGARDGGAGADGAGADGSGSAGQESLTDVLLTALDAGDDGFAVFETVRTNGAPRLRLLYGNAAAEAALELTSGDLLSPCLPPRPAAQLWGLVWEALLEPRGFEPRGYERATDQRVTDQWAGDQRATDRRAAHRQRVAAFSRMRSGGDPDGWWDVCVRPVSAGRVLVTWRDATDDELERGPAERAARTIEEAATRDVLTGLANRTVLRHGVEQALRTCPPGQRVGVLLCTLGGTADAAAARYGRPVGDAVLLATAERLRRTVRPGDLVARVADDTFAVVLHHLPAGIDPVALAQRYADRLNRPVAARRTLLRLSTGLGLVLADPFGGALEDRDAAELLVRAYEAMQRSRLCGVPVASREPPGPAERERLLALESYDVFDDALDDLFHAVAQIALVSCGARTALVSFVDENVEWVRGGAGPGLPLGAWSCTPRHLSLADATVQGRSVLELADVLGDPRVTSRHAAHQFGMASYAAAPLVNPEGRAIGAIAVLDDVPHVLTPRQRRTLVTQADELMGILEARRHPSC